ncbi:MAG TPA: amidase [Steroidobacteraceae bacterium]|nr:amidase [Steroidobacteraceae bacterium]
MTSRMAGRILVTALLLSPLAARAQTDDGFPFLEATVAQLQARMASGELTSVQLTRAYLERIHNLDSSANGVNAIIELNPDALAMARKADDDRSHGKVLGPLHGIPVLLKANVDTGDRMQTTAGSFALHGVPPMRDSTVAANLRAGDAVILGKTNLSEWANFRSFESISGWSGIGGQTHNPYGIDRNPCGSSSGSGAAASANFATVSFGTETDGSIVCPGNANGVVALKPTVGLTSRAGIVPISHTQDTFGPHARTVADAAAALGVVQSVSSDGRDPATGGVPLGWQGTGKTRPTNIPSDYTKFLDPNGLKGAVLGITRQGLNGFDSFVPTPAPVTAAVEAAFKALTDAGATLVDLDALKYNFSGGPGEFEVLCYDFRNDVRAYFATRSGVPVAGGTLADAIAFNSAHAAVEMPYFNQDIFDLCNSMAPGPDDAQPAFGGVTYNQALKSDQDFTVNNVDAALNAQHLDAIVSATDNPAWATDLLFGDHFIFGTSSIAASGGYPIVQVPAGEVFGVPLGISFFGTAFSEPKLIKLASGYEAFTHSRAHNLPTFAATVPFDHIKGPLQQAAAGDGQTQSGASSVSSQAAQGAPAVAGAAAVAAPNQAASAKSKKALHHL